MRYKLSHLYTCIKVKKRQASEGVEIRHGEQEVNIIKNSKLEHCVPVVGGLVMERGVAGRGRGARRRGN